MVFLHNQPFSFLFFFFFQTRRVPTTHAKMVVLVPWLQTDTPASVQECTLESIVNQVRLYLCWNVTVTLVVNYTRVTMAMYSMAVSTTCKHIRMHHVNSIHTHSMLASGTHAPRQQHSHLLHVSIRYACITSTACFLVHLLLLSTSENPISKTFHLVEMGTQYTSILILKLERQQEVHMLLGRRRTNSSVFLQASYSGAGVVHHVSLGLLGSICMSVWSGMSMNEPLLVIGSASTMFGMRPGTVGLVGRGWRSLICCSSPGCTRNFHGWADKYSESSSQSFSACPFSYSNPCITSVNASHLLTDSTT